jgi:hypothetical protein
VLTLIVPHRLDMQLLVYFHEPCLVFSAVPLFLLAPVSTDLKVMGGTSTANCEGPFEAPIASVGITAVYGEHLCYARIEGREFRPS